MMSFRLTEKDYNEIMAQFRLSGYKSRTRYLTETLLDRGGKTRTGDIPDKQLQQNCRLMKQIYLEMVREGTNLNQLVKALNTLAGKDILTGRDINTIPKLISQASIVAGKLTWRSRDIHEIAVRIECKYLPDEEE